MERFVTLTVVLVMMAAFDALVDAFGMERVFAWLAIGARTAYAAALAGLGFCLWRHARISSSR